MKNLFKYASLLFAAAVLFSCGEKAEPEEEGTNSLLESIGLRIELDKNLIKTFDDDFAKLTVIFRDTMTVSAGETFVDPETEKEKVMTLDTLVLVDSDVTEESDFYMDNKPLELPDFKFSTTKKGVYKIVANYGTFISEPATINAISVEIPQTPADPKPNSTDFKARVLVTEFTTTGCSYCPGMKKLLHGAAENPDIADKVVLTACHDQTINSVKDPAYIKTTYDDFAGATMPYVYCDMYYGFGYYPTWVVSNMMAELNKLYDAKKDGAAGIAVNSSMADGQLIVKATVKAAIEGEYAIGLFLLEDGIYGKQSNTNDTWMHVHDGVIRYIDAKANILGKECYYGYPVGKVRAGGTADYVFVLDLEQIWADGSKYGKSYGGTAWGNDGDTDPQTEKKGQEEFVNGKDLHIAVFASVLDGNNGYVSNVIDCPIDDQTPYEYR